MPPGARAAAPPNPPLVPTGRAAALRAAARPAAHRQGVGRRRRLGERVRCAHLEGIEVGAARGAPIQLGASCFSGRGCAIESGETGGKVKPDTTLGLLAGPPETPERLQGGGALSGGAPPPEAIDLMGMNVAPPEAGNGEGGDASTPWFSGQDARGPARLASTVDDAPAGGAFAPHLVGQRQKRSPRGRACVRAGRPGAGRSRTEAPTRRRRTSSHGGQCPRRTTGAELEARALPREPQRIERLSAIVSGAGACHHWGSAMATWGRASGPPNPPLVPTGRAAALRAAARPAAHRQGVGRRRRLGERVRCAHLEGIEVGAARGAPIQLGASCFSGRGCAIESGETGGKVKPGTTLGLLAGPPERPERLQGGGALSGGAPPPEAIDLMGMNVAPHEAGDGEGGDASTSWFSGQDARGPARLASTVDEAPTGGAFAPPPGWATTEAISPGGACVRAGRPGAGRSRTEAPTRRRRMSSHGGRCPRRTAGAEPEARALPRQRQRIERLSAIVSGAGACHHWGSAMATWGRASGPPNPPLVPTVRAAALRAAARTAAHRQTVGRAGVVPKWAGQEAPACVGHTVMLGVGAHKRGLVLVSGGSDEHVRRR